MRNILRLLSFCILYNPIFSQSDTIPVSATIEVNGVKATVWSNGRLFGSETEGQFFKAHSDIPMLRAAGLWIGGVDPAGNLKGTIQTTNEGGKSDFYPGLIDWETKEHIDFNKIWRVTKEDIDSHLQDFYDNRRIDNPNPAVFAWPGENNPYFEEYNGFPIPKDKKLAPFWDENGNGNYEPDDGDHPIFKNRGCGKIYYGDEMLWFAYHDNKPHTESGMDPIQVEIRCLLFAFNCESHEFMTHTLYANYQIRNQAVESIDSTFVGIYLDTQQGCPEDDYIGSLPDANTIFVYNSDKEDPPCTGFQGLGNDPPVFSATLYRGPLDEFGNEISLTSVMPLYDSSSTTISGKQFPESPIEYFRYLNGEWKDGTPLTFGEDGYQDGEAIKFVFPGNPANKWEWTEGSANQAPGKRKILAATGSFRLDPGAIQEITVGFSYDYAYYSTGVYNSRRLENKIYNLRGYLDNCFGGPPFSTWCTRPRVPFDEPPSKVNLMPNPAKEAIEIQFYDIRPEKIYVVDMLGRIFYEQANPPVWQRIDVDTWPAGVYFFKAEEEGVNITRKFVVEN